MQQKLRPTDAMALQAAGAPDSLQSVFGQAGGIVFGLTIAQWGGIAKRRGPATWDVLADVLASANGQELPPVAPPVPPTPPTPHASQAAPDAAPEASQLAQEAAQHEP